MNLFIIIYFWNYFPCRNHLIYVEYFLCDIGFHLFFTFSKFLKLFLLLSERLIQVILRRKIDFF